jgi:hypothetical protein
MGIAVGAPYAGGTAPGFVAGLPMAMPPPLPRAVPALPAPPSHAAPAALPLAARSPAPPIRTAPAAQARSPASPARAAAGTPSAGGTPNSGKRAMDFEGGEDAWEASGGGAGGAHPSGHDGGFVNEEEAEALTAAAERQALAARDATASQLALKAASKILATKAKRRKAKGDN